MKLILDGGAATEAVMCMRDGVWQREGILSRLKFSRCSARLHAAAFAADNSLHETEKAMGCWRQNGSGDLQASLLRQHSEFLRLAGEGWGTLEFMAEAGRYLPVVFIGSDQPKGLHFYNPATGAYDLPIDRGWSSRGLPPRGKPQSL